MSSPKRKLPVRAMSFENNDREAPPSIAALFLVQFDPKVGYTIAWQRSLSGISLEDVEYKSLPSGLHHVKEDLIYFTHHKYAGLSAFRNDPSAAAGNRNATFTSVGILLRHRRGRIGRGWLHARALKELAQDLSSLSEQTSSLERYWEAYEEKSLAEGKSKADAGDNSSVEQRLSVETTRPDLSLSHPVLCVEQLLEEFGPLLFPAYRAALLRKKILFIKKPPLCEVCHYVYVLSLISSIPPILVETLSNIKPRRSRSLFSIVVHDVDNLTRPIPEPDPDEVDPEDEEEYGGWIACTSDEILATKQKLSDLQIRISSESKSASTSGSPWPSLTSSTSEAVKATQRDMRRYKVLRQGLAHLEREPGGRYRDADEADDIGDAHLLHQKCEEPSDIFVPKEDTIVESLPWAAVAYDSFIWWASAGERNLQIEDEQAYDRELLMTSSEVWDSHMTMSMSSYNRALPSGGLEVAIVAYFHRMTTVTFEVLCDIMDTQDGSDAEVENDGHGGAIVVQRADLVRMGLDEWSKKDREFVVDLVRLYFHREAIVEGAKVECCGVKIY